MFMIIYRNANSREQAALRTLSSIAVLLLSATFAEDGGNPIIGHGH
jgi:hypothetical protein